MSAVSIDEQKLILTQFVEQCRKRRVKIIVLDMDKTLITIHTGGFVKEADLEKFKGSLSSVARALLPLLLEEKFELSVCTRNDELRSLIESTKDQKLKKPSQKYFSGIPLVKDLLATVLTDDQIKLIPIVSLDPKLYEKARGPEDPLNAYFQKKLDDVGLPKADVKDGKVDWVKEARQFPPGKNKNQHLKILRALKGFEFNQMLLVDDEQENCKEAIKLGAFAVYVPGKNAVEWADLTKIMDPPQPQQPPSDG